MVTFTDGDARVYLKSVVNEAVVRRWNKLKDSGETEDTAEVVAESTDKDALIRMAMLARHGYVMEWEDEHGEHNPTIVDRTHMTSGQQFP